MRAFVAIALLLTAGCAEAPRSPTQTVDRYFAVLARDPVRTLLLVTPDFHIAHGLPAWRPEDRSGRDAPEPLDLPPASRRVAVEDGRVGWLSAQMTPQVQRRVRQTSYEITAEEVEGEEALVVTAVKPLRGAAFTQRFLLVRDDEGWRIDRIEQEGPPGAANEMARYAIYPNEVLAQRLLDLPRANP